MRKPNARAVFTSNQMFLIYIIVALCLAIGLVNHAFFNFSTVITLSRAMLCTLCFAVCEMVVIISGGIDVSFPAVACASLYITVKVMTTNGMDSIFMGFFIAAVIGLIVGVANAILIALVKIPPLIATLATSSMTSGTLLTFFGNSEISRIPSKLSALSGKFILTYTSNANGNTYRLTVFILVPIILCFVVFFILRFTMLGRGIYAIGGDENAARVSGFNVIRLKFIVYIFCGVMAGVTGMIYCILCDSANPIDLMGSEMMIIAAVVVGGTNIAGGHGTVFGTILGVTLIALIQNNLLMLGVPSYWQTFIVGAVIVAGTTITAMKTKISERRLKV